MSRMTYAEKQERTEARYYGRRCRISLEHLASNQVEANHWRQRDDFLFRMWHERADLNEQDAISYARSAAHHARLSLAAADGIPPDKDEAL